MLFELKLYGKRRIEVTGHFPNATQHSGQAVTTLPGISTAFRFASSLNRAYHLAALNERLETIHQNGRSSGMEDVSIWALEITSAGGCCCGGAP